MDPYAKYKLCGTRSCLIVSTVKFAISRHEHHFHSLVTIVVVACDGILYGIHACVPSQ
jgi:hypothetical protein